MKPDKNRCTLNDLRSLEVINTCNGARLGCVCDIEFDLCSGTIQAILVPKRMEWNELFCKKDKRCVRIPWCCIERIGNDIILVKIENC